MPTVRVNFFFQQEGYGWTETYWTTGTDDDLRSYNAKANNLAAKRILLSGAQTYLEAVRVSAENVFRDATGFTFPDKGLQGKTTQESDPPATALLIGMKDLTARKARNIFLRGVWDAVVKEGGKFEPTPQYSSYLNAYFAELTQQNWGWLGATTRTVGLITAAVQQPSGTVQVDVGSDVFTGPFPVDASVRISGVLGASEINGQVIVRASTARRFETRRRVAIFPYTTGGRVTYNVKGFISCFLCSPKRIVERKPGRPSYRSVGRQRARAAS